MEKKREVENLIDIEDMDYAQALKDGKIEMYENELSLVEGYSPFSNIPHGVAKLEEKAQYFLYYYLTGGIQVDGTGKNSKGNHLLSYILTFENWKEIVSKLFYEESKYELGNNGQEYLLGIVYKKKDPILYAKWNMRAMSYWNDNALHKHIKDFEMILNGSIDKNEELKRQIYDDAMYAEDRVDRTNNRKMYIDISGMKEDKSKVTFNVYNNGGGKERTKALSEEIGVSRFDISEAVSGK